MRVQISKKELDIFFQKVRNKTGLSWKAMAIDLCKVSPRTLLGWRSGKYTMPGVVLDKLCEETGFDKPCVEKELKTFWYVEKSSSLGGKRRQELYGDLGTPEGRRKGGLRSVAKNRSLQRVAFLPKHITLPSKSLQLAEFVGILLGDGGVTPYQVSITLNRYDDESYINYVGELCKGLFGFAPSLHYRASVCTIVISRVELVRFLLKFGIVLGSKVRHQVAVPDWILQNYDYIKACLRGLMDTDGCFYIDRHQYKNKVYLNGGLNFTNRSLPLLNFCKNTLLGLGLHPTQRTPYSIFLRRESEISQYFKVVGSSNLKHVNKYRDYIYQRSGEVPKWS